MAANLRYFLPRSPGRSGRATAPSRPIGPGWRERIHDRAIAPKGRDSDRGSRYAFNLPSCFWANRLERAVYRRR